MKYRAMLAVMVDAETSNRKKMIALHQHLKLRAISIQNN